MNKVLESFVVHCLVFADISRIFLSCVSNFFVTDSLNIVNDAISGCTEAFQVVFVLKASKIHFFKGYHCTNIAVSDQGPIFPRKKLW